MIEKADRDAMMGFVHEAVSRGVKLVVTDEHRGCDMMTDSGRAHEIVKDGDKNFLLVHFLAMYLICWEFP
jgi:hypothetical protein